MRDGVSLRVGLPRNTQVSTKLPVEHIRTQSNQEYGLGIAVKPILWSVCWGMSFSFRACIHLLTSVLWHRNYPKTADDESFGLSVRTGDGDRKRTSKIGWGKDLWTLATIASGWFRNPLTAEHILEFGCQSIFQINEARRKGELKDDWEGCLSRPGIQDTIKATMEEWLPARRKRELEDDPWDGRLSHTTWNTMKTRSRLQY